MNQGFRNFIKINRFLVWFLNIILIQDSTDPYHLKGGNIILSFCTHTTFQQLVTNALLKLNALKLYAPQYDSIKCMQFKRFTSPAYGIFNLNVCRCLFGNISLMMQTEYQGDILAHWCHHTNKITWVLKYSKVKDKPHSFVILCWYAHRL